MFRLFLLRKDHYTFIGRFFTFFIFFMSEDQVRETLIKTKIDRFLTLIDITVIPSLVSNSVTPWTFFVAIRISAKIMTIYIIVWFEFHSMRIIFIPCLTFKSALSKVSMVGHLPDTGPGGPSRFETIPECGHADRDTNSFQYNLSIQLWLSLRSKPVAKVSF